MSWSLVVHVDKDGAPHATLRETGKMDACVAVEPYQLPFFHALHDLLRGTLHELASIDEALARRPALADLKTRYEKVYLACEIAGRLEVALAKLKYCEENHK